jgi:hypothetical protein
MPVTEILILSFKQDEATREGFKSTLLPTMSTIMVGKPGLLVKPVAGQMMSSNGKDVSSTFQPVFGLGMWICIPMISL